MLQPFQYAGSYQAPRGVDVNMDPRTDKTEGLQGIQTAIEKTEAKEEAKTAKQEAVDRFAQMKKEATAAMATNDPNVINQFVIDNAEFKEAMKIAEMHSHKTKRTLNNSQELSYAYIMAGTDEERQALVDERIKVMNEDGVPPEQRKQTEEFLEAHYEGSTEEAKLMLHKRLMVGDNDRYNKFLENNAMDVPGKPEQEPGPETNEDRFVKDKVQEWQEANPGKKLPGGKKARWRVEHKRVTGKGAFEAELGKGDAQIKTAYLKEYNKVMGNAEATMKTAIDMVHARGERTPEEKRIDGAQDMTTKLSALRGLYQALDEQGGIVNTQKGTMDNLWAAAEASGAGQLIGRMTGTKNQQSRNSIETIRPMLIQDIRKASEMGTRGLDSEKELAFYMKAATDTTIDIATNMAALAMLDSVYGSGDLAAEIRASIPPEKQKAFDKETEKMVAEGKEILDGRDIPTVRNKAAFDKLPEGAAYYKKGDPDPWYKPFTGDQ